MFSLTRILLTASLALSVSAHATIRFSADEADGIVTEGCAATIAHINEHFGYGAQILAMTLKGERFEGAGRAIIEKYFAEEQSKGRNPIFIAQDIQLLRGFFGDLPTDKISPTLDRAHQLMGKILLRKGNAPSVAFTLDDLSLVPRHATIRQTIESFATFNLPLTLDDPEAFLYAQTENLSLDIRDGSFTSREDAVNLIRQVSFGNLSLYGVAVHNGRSRGLHFASAIRNVLFPESVVHEMAHAVQTRRWDYFKILDYYFTHIKPHADKLPNHMRPPARILETHVRVQERLLRKGIGDDYADQLFTRWNSLEAHAQDFIFFCHFVCLLAEVDAHLQQGWMAEESGFSLPMFSSGLFAHLQRAYVGERGPIHPTSFKLAMKDGSEAILKFVRELNASFR